MNLSWRQIILYLTTLGIEGCWLYALIIMLNDRITRVQLSPVALMALFPISFVINRGLRKLAWPPISIRTINFILWIAAALLSVKLQLFGSLSISDTAWLASIPEALGQIIYAFRPELLILCLSAVLWWLARRMAYQKISFVISVAEFQFGFVILALVFFGSAQLGTGMGHTLPVAVAFFLFSLLSMAISHSNEGVWLWGARRGAWSGLLLLSVIVIIILGFIISIIVTPDLLQVILDVIKWMWDQVMKAISWLASLLPAPGPSEPLPGMPGITGSEPVDEGPPIAMPEWLRNILQFGWTIVFVGLAVFALWQIMSYVLRRLGRSFSLGAQTESLRGAFKADLLNLLRSILRTLGALRLFPRLRKKTARLRPEIASVREIYRQILRWAASGGYPRKPAQTPYEYLGILLELVPEADSDLSLITRHYVNTRYGAYMPAESDLQQLKKSWHNIKKYNLKKQRPTRNKR